MKKLALTLAGATLALGTLALTATNASAAVVCNGAGYCWHTQTAYHYEPTFGVTIHPDGWKWDANEHYAWHEHEDRGYWRDGAWVTF